MQAADEEVVSTAFKKLEWTQQLLYVNKHVGAANTKWAGQWRPGLVTNAYLKRCTLTAA